jgi:hypothetical protein
LASGVTLCGLRTVQVAGGSLWDSALGEIAKSSPVDTAIAAQARRASKNFRFTGHLGSSHSATRTAAKLIQFQKSHRRLFSRHRRKLCAAPQPLREHFSSLTGNAKLSVHFEWPYRYC